MKSSLFIAALSFRCLKRDLGMTYKKLEIKPAPATTNQMFRKLLEGAKIQKCLKDKQVECIYIDEFTINTRHSQFRGWAKRGVKGWVKINKSDFAMSFIWALSDYQIYGILGVEGSITSEVFKHYIIELVSKRKCTPRRASEPFVFIWDNSRVHSNELINSFLVKSRLRAISIQQYSPVLNPWEKLINSIKSKIKIMHSEGRQVYFSFNNFAID